MRLVRKRLKETAKDRNERVEPLDLSKIRGCLLAGPGRGDCEHAVGLPRVEEYPATVDQYNVTHGWCIVCWKGEIIGRLHKRLRVLKLGVEEVERSGDRNGISPVLTESGPRPERYRRSPDGPFGG